jgi:hypothetical protein
MDISSEEIARQITLREWDIWQSVRPWEFLGAAWTRPDKETRAPNGIFFFSCSIFGVCCLDDGRYIGRGRRREEEGGRREWDMAVREALGVFGCRVDQAG